MGTVGERCGSGHAGGVRIPKICYETRLVFAWLSTNMLMLASLNSIDFSGILFWCLLPAVIFGRGKWAVLAWLAMTNLDATGPHTASNANIGWINAIKSLLLPCVVVVARTLD